MPASTPIVFTTRVVGVSFGDHQERLGQLTHETPIQLVPDHDNPHDPHAVKVEALFPSISGGGTKSSWAQIGFVPRLARGCNACLYVLTKHELAFWCPRCERTKIEPIQLGLRTFNFLTSRHEVEAKVDTIFRRKKEEHHLGLAIAVAIRSKHDSD